jgi:uncharacterized membrane protein
MERKYLFGIEDGGKTASMISYFFVLGWSLSFFGFHQNNKTELSSYHLRQTLFLFLSYVVIRMCLYVWAGATWQLSGLTQVINYLVIILNAGFVVLWVNGLNSASKAEEKPMPLVGEVAQRVFSFI